MRIQTSIQSNPPDKDITYEKAKFGVGSWLTRLGRTQDSSLQPPARTRLQKALKNAWLKFCLRLGCTVLLFFILFNSIAKSISLSSLVAKLATLDSGMLLIGIIVGLFCVIISAYQWQCLLNGERIHIDLHKLVNLYLVGIAFNHFLPTGMGGDIVKAYYVGKEGQNVPGSASAVIMSRVTGFFGMMFVAIPTIIIWHTIFNPSLIALFLLLCLAMCIALGGTLSLVTLLPKLADKRSKRELVVGNTKLRTKKKEFVGTGRGQAPSLHPVRKRVGGKHLGQGPALSLRMRILLLFESWYKGFATGQAQGTGSAPGTVPMAPGQVPGTVPTTPLLSPLLKVGKTIRTSCTRPHFICKATLFGTIFHLSAALNYYCYAKMLNVTVPINFYMVAIPLISLVSFLPISLNGYGLRESALVAIFATIHVSASIVLLTALLIDIQALLFGATGGLIYLTMDQHHLAEQNTPRSPTAPTKKLPI